MFQYWKSVIIKYVCRHLKIGDIFWVSWPDYRNLCGGNGLKWSKNNLSKVKWRFRGCKMITATGNRMPLLKTASHNTVSESVASLTFFFPSALSHTINFTSLSIPKSSSFHAKARLVTSFFACWVSPLLRRGSSFSTEYKLQLHWCRYMISKSLCFPWI